MTRELSRQRGFTLIEVLVVVSIIALLAVALLFSVRSQRQKAEDARIKSDLARLQVAFEDYYQDNNCYPPSTWFDSTDDCGGNQLSPYLNSIPCDPSGIPYRIEKDNTGCSWYKAYGLLSQGDPKLCVTVGGSYLGNYAISSTNVLATPNCAATRQTAAAVVTGGTPVTPNGNPVYDPTKTYYYCSDINNCTHNANPASWYCAPEFVGDPNCGGACNSAGSCVPR